MAPSKDASSSGSSKQASQSSRRTSDSGRATSRKASTQPTSLSSAAGQSSNGRQLASGVASLQIEDVPERQHNTRLRTGALKRKDLDESKLTAAPSEKRAKAGKAAASLKGLYNPSEIGSPWDATPRQELRVVDLDLHRSYVGSEPVNSSASASDASGPERPQRQKRWKHRGKEPLTDIHQLPKGWNTREPDLLQKYVFISRRR